MGNNKSTKPIPEIQSAWLNLRTAKSDCDWAMEQYLTEKWQDAILLINDAVSHLESAKAKIKRHMKEKP